MQSRIHTSSQHPVAGQEPSSDSQSDMISFPNWQNICLHKLFYFNSPNIPER